MRWFVVLPLLVVGLGGCDKPAPGEACETTGDGFTRKDPCEHTCVEWEVTCADESVVVPGVCSGKTCEGDGDCPSGFGCAEVDSFSRACLPQSLCPEGFHSSAGGGGGNDEKPI